MEPWILTTFIGVAFSIIGWLLANKDKKQSEEIKAESVSRKEDDDAIETNVDLLFKLYHELEKDLSAFKLEIAKNHYPKHELDQRFAELNLSIKEGFGALSGELKEMNKSLHNHFDKHHSGGQQ
jgi:hypothetical protein